MSNDFGLGDKNMAERGQKNSNNQRKRQSDRICTGLKPITAKDIMHMYTQTYLLHCVKDWAENEGILRSRGQAVDGRMTAEPPISVILATSSLLTVTFRAYGGRETSKKVRIRINISRNVCLQFTNKIWLDMAEKGRSEGMRTKCAPGEIEPLPHRFITFQSNKMK